MTVYADPAAVAANVKLASSGAAADPYDLNSNFRNAIMALKDLLDGTEEHGTDFNFQPGAGFDFIATLGDAAGANKISVLDSALAEVASINSDGDLNIEGVETIVGLGTGGITDYDLSVGDTDGTPSYGIIRMGNSIIGRTSYSAGSIDLDGTMIFRNVGGPVTSEIDFVFVESGGTSTRFALPVSGVGNATYNSRSMLIAGPAPADTDYVKVSYWQGQGIFDNLVCDTDGDGADVGVQNDLEVEGDIFTDSILESTTGAGVTIDSLLIKDGEANLTLLNGSIVETIDIGVTSDGATITFSLQRNGGGDLTLLFSDGFTALDTTPAVTIALTAGSATSPQINYVYIPQSTKILTISTTAFPSAEHVPLATVIVQTAALVQTNGALKVHAWTDHMEGTDNQGHLSHIGEWIRNQHATWLSGAAQTLTITPASPDTVHFATTSGTILQLHPQTLPAFDTSTGSIVHVVNDNASPYTTVTDLADLLTDNAGGSMSGRYFNLVIWASISEDTGDSQLFVNLPSGSYVKQTDAEQDVSGYTVFNFPANFKGAAFLLSRLLLKHATSGGGDWTSVEEADLRGKIPSAAAGTTTQAIATTFADNTFALFDESDATKLLAFQLSGITTGNTRMITMPDQDITLIDAAGAITAVEGEATLALGGDVTIASGKTFSALSGDIVVSDGFFRAASEAVALSNGDNNNVAVARGFAYVSGPTAAFAITGIVAPSDGAILRIYNSVNQNMTISNQSGSSSAANRIVTLDGADHATSGIGLITLIYSTTLSRWLLASEIL